MTKGSLILAPSSTKCQAFWRKWNIDITISKNFLLFSWVCHSSIWVTTMKASVYDWKWQNFSSLQCFDDEEHHGLGILHVNIEDVIFSEISERDFLKFEIFISEDLLWPESSSSASRYFCSSCPRSYKYKSDLRRHQSLECGKEPQFLCPYCPKRCKRKTHLKNHVGNIHKSIYAESLEVLWYHRFHVHSNQCRLILQKIKY